MGQDELANHVLWKVAGLRDARTLEQRCLRRDMWIEPASRCGDEVDWNRHVGVLCAAGLRVCLDAFDQGRAGGPEIGAAGPGRVVAITRCGRTGMEILFVNEGAARSDRTR